MRYEDFLDACWTAHYCEEVVRGMQPDYTRKLEENKDDPYKEYESLEEYERMVYGDKKRGNGYEYASSCN